MLIADSSVLIDYLNGADTAQVRRLEDELASKRVGIGDLMLFEVLQGIRSEREFDEVRAELLKLPVHEMVTAETAVQAARNYRLLRRRGITTRKSHDVLIATYCIEHGHELLHNDRDFDPFEEHLGLKVVH